MENQLKCPICEEITENLDKFILVSSEKEKSSVLLKCSRCSALSSPSKKMVFVDVTTSLDKEERKTNMNFSEKTKMELGIEILAALKADVYKVDMESGRIMVLENTELDRMSLYTLKEQKEMSKEEKIAVKKKAEREKIRMHNQALFLAEAVATFLDKMLVGKFLTSPKLSLQPPFDPEDNIKKKYI